MRLLATCTLVQRQHRRATQRLHLCPNQVICPIPTLALPNFQSIQTQKGPGPFMNPKSGMALRAEIFPSFTSERLIFLVERVPLLIPKNKTLACTGSGSLKLLVI
jgi:hypothetical protein